jgi:drug/metabolite transporter (DMT)-like permease
MGWFSKRLPLFLVFFSGFGFSIQGLIVKLLAEDNYHTTFVCILSRGIVQTILGSAIAYRESGQAGASKHFFGDSNWVRFVMFGRSLVGFFGISFAFLAVSELPLGDASVLLMLSPAFASFFSFLILGEPWRLVEMAATVISLTGACLVAKPPFLFGADGEDGGSGGENMLGVVYGLAGAVSAGSAFVFVRMLGTTAKMPWSHVCVAQAMMQSTLAIPFLYVFGQQFEPVDAHKVGLIVAGAMIGAVSQIAMTIGMQREKSAAATAMRMSDVLFGYTWQAIFTADVISALSVFGATLVTGSILLVVMFKQKESVAQQQLPVVDGSAKSVHGGKDDGGDVVPSPVTVVTRSPLVGDKGRLAVNIKLPKVSLSTKKAPVEVELGNYSCLPQSDAT